MRTWFWTAVLGGLSSVAFPAQDVPSETRFHRIYLRNGNFIDGQMTGQTLTEVTLKLGIGQMSIRRDLIDRVEWITMRSLQEAPRGLGRGRASTPGIPAGPDSAAAGGPGAPPARPATPLVLTQEVSPKLRQAIDLKIRLWQLGRGHRPEALTQDLVDLGPSAVPYLGALLCQRPGEIPVPALCSALGRIGDPEAVPYLSQLLLQSEISAHRAAAVGALGYLGTKEGIALLFKSLNDSDAEVWSAAGKELADLSRRGMIPSLVPTLVERMKEAKDKTAFAIALGQAGGREAHDALLDLLGQGDEGSRLSGLQGLREMPDQKDGAAIVALLSTSSTSVRMEACVALGRLKYQPALAELIELLKSPEAGIVLNAHWALREMTGERFPPDPELWARWWENWNRHKKK